MKKIPDYRFPLLLLFSLLLVGCGNGSNPSKVVERYLSAKVSQDEDRLRDLLCSEMEERYEMELASFASASDATIEEMVCTWQEGDSVVDCTGKIVASYEGEVSEYSLSTYRVVEEESGWKWCGEAP